MKQCYAILGLEATNKPTIAVLVQAYRKREREFLERLAGTDLITGQHDSDDMILDKQAKRQELVVNLDRLWAAALHVETALHLQEPGSLCNWSLAPLSLSLMDPNPSSAKQALLLHLLHLLRCVRQQSLVWEDDSVYSLLPIDQRGWQTHKAHYGGELQSWIWRCCDKELHYGYWSLLVESVSCASIARLLCAQVEFLRLRRNALAWRGHVYLIDEQCWAEGCAERTVPDQIVAIDGDNLFWATVLGWPLRGVAGGYFPTGEPCLELLADPSLPIRQCNSKPCAPVFVIDRIENAIAASFLQDAIGPMHGPTHGPLDRWLK